VQPAGWVTALAPGGMAASHLTAVVRVQTSRGAASAAAGNWAHGNWTSDAVQCVVGGGSTAVRQHAAVQHPACTGSEGGAPLFACAGLAVLRRGDMRQSSPAQPNGREGLVPHRQHTPAAQSARDSSAGPCRLRCCFAAGGCWAPTAANAHPRQLCTSCYPSFPAVPSSSRNLCSLYPLLPSCSCI
jgi:hypothetical protein